MVGVNVAVGVFVGVFFGVRVTLPLGVGVNVGSNVGDPGGPFWMLKTLSEKPGDGVGLEDEPPPPVQLSKSAPQTNNTTGEITSHLSHRDINIKQ